MFKAVRNFIFLILFIGALANCAMGSPTGGGSYSQLLSRPLSLNSSHLRTCIFDPAYPIVHFPMQHAPPTGHYTSRTYTEGVLSQFQLLHTIIDYINSPIWQLVLFDEHITSDDYDEVFFQALSSGQASSESYTTISGQTFYMGERMQTAQHLFSGNIPGYYEHLSPAQKDFLFNTGASLTLYLLGYLPKIHKVISQDKWKLAEANFGQSLWFGGAGDKNNYWVFDFREQSAKDEMLNLFHQSYRAGQIFMIAYGTGHDFSDEFAGYPFQSGHNSCLGWQNDPALFQILP